MSTMVERSVIPERIMEQAIDTLDLLRGSFGDFDRDDNAAIIAETLLAAEKRGKEEAAIRGERAVGNTIEEMRANVSTDLTNLGDTVLAWVNEGDLIMSELCAAAIRGS